MEYKDKNLKYQTSTENERTLKWSGSKPVPQIGERVEINFNGLGTGRVAGYACSGNYLALEVVLDNPPAWWIKQNPDREFAWIFGTDLS